MSYVHMIGKKLLCDIILFPSHLSSSNKRSCIFLYRGNAASAGEVTLDCTELRCCNQEPVNSGAVQRSMPTAGEKKVLCLLITPTFT